MVTDEGPKVIEYNCRFGDPEAQVVLPLIKNDLGKLLFAVCNECLHEHSVENLNQTAVCVVMASGGYPENYESGKLITGIEDAESNKDVFVFHSGTIEKKGRIYTNGGRVLGVTAVGNDLKDTINHAYDAVDKIHFENSYYRNDIGLKGVLRVN